MANTNPSSARLSRSTTDPSGVKRQRTLETSSRAVDAGKGTLPQAKIQALEQFVKFGRKGEQKETAKSNQKAAEFPPPSWFEPRSISTTSPPPGSVAAADYAPKTTTARGVPQRDMSSPLPTPRAPPHLSPRTVPTTGSEPPSTSPEIAPSTSRRANTTQTGADFSHTTGTASADPGNGISPSSASPTLHRRGSSFPGPGALDGDSEDVAPPEPITLARRIQTLLSPWSAYQAPTATPPATDATTSSGAPQSEAAGPATPDGSIPPGPVPISDSRFLSFLSNENVMGGSLDKSRQSVFAALDRLRRPSDRATEPPVGSKPSSVSEREQDDDDDDGDSSIMLYGPLVPSEDSEVELAASDVMSVFDDGETFEFERPARPLSFAGAGEHLTPRSTPTALPPEPSQQQSSADACQPDAPEEPANGATGWFDTWKGKVIEGGKLVSDKVAEGTKSLKDKVVDGRKVVKTRTRWVPSPDKISFQATWWGYRLYLPPPVLDVLNNKRLEAAKRAAIITTALQWLLGRVPLSVVPAQFRFGVVVAQRLVPYLGYVGGFVAWSWGAMKSFDKGHGIVLTATWLLPVALIPGTWEANHSPGTGASPAPGASTSDLSSARVG